MSCVLEGCWQNSSGWGGTWQGLVGKAKVQERHLWQRLAVLLVMDNVAMLNSRIPTFPPAEVNGEENFS